MEQKLIEIRDDFTCITAIAIKTEPQSSAETAFLNRGGWGPNSVILIKCNGDCIANHDPFNWGISFGRTMTEAHRYLEEHFDEIPNHYLLDVRYILGESDQPCKSDIWGD